MDDDESICKMAKRVLEERGYGVDVAHNSAEAMKKLLSKTFDVLILDYLMPQGDGSFLYKHVRAMKPELAKQTLIITGAGTDERLIKLLRSADNRFLRKPFSMTELEQAIESLLACGSLV
ncbi:MAG: response regulator [Acidobacteriota bacterium]